MLLTVEGERDGEALKLRAQAIQSLDEAAAGVQRGLKVVLDGRAFQADAARSTSSKALLKPGGKGIVCLSMALEDRRPRGGDRHARPLRRLAGAEGRHLHRARRAGGGGYLRGVGPSPGRGVINLKNCQTARVN